MNSPKVSVIIPTYNRANILPRAIDSVLAQTYKDYEIIIIDDGSTDNTKELLKPYLRKENIYYLYQKNQKQAAARNKGIRHSNGEYIAFLDSDDLWYPEKLELQVTLLDEHPAIGAVCTNQMIVDTNYNDVQIRYLPEQLKSGNILKELFLRKFYCSTQTILVRRSVFNNVGLFDETLKNALEDWELTLRIAKKYEVAWIREPLVKRRVNFSQDEHYFETRIENHKKILKRYLNFSSLEKSFIDTVWRKAFFSWGHIYLNHRIYGKAFIYFCKSFLKGNWVAISGVVLSLLGPLGRITFEQLVHLKINKNKI